MVKRLHKETEEKPGENMQRISRREGNCIQFAHEEKKGSDFAHKKTALWKKHCVLRKGCLEADFGFRT